jgi:methionyl-tRNA formyltransferase
MTKQDFKIVFMGTPDFAVEALQRLVEGGYNVVAVITMPDKSMGRHGSVLQASPVKQYALSRNIPVLQPEKLKDTIFVNELRSFDADLQVVVAFRMLPEVVWSMPRYGTFNVHAALLPQYRGAAPINWAIINGETETGITTFFLTHDIDTGKIIQQERVPILLTDNAEDVHDKLMHLGARLCIETVDAIIAGDVNPIQQEKLYHSEADLKPAPKIFKETCRIPWKNKTTKQIYDFIRGLSPYPTAWTMMKNTEGKEFPLKIYASSYVLDSDTTVESSRLPIGTIVSDHKKHMAVKTIDGRIEISDLQLAGKRRQDISAFLCGMHKIESYYME